MEQGSELTTGPERRAFLQEGNAVSENALKKSLSKLPGMTIGKRKEWIDTRHYTELLGDLSQKEWSSLLGMLGEGEGVVSTILSSLFSESGFADRSGLWNAVVAMSPLPPWMKVAYQAGCVVKTQMVKFFITALGFLRGAIQLLFWLIVGSGMVLSGGRIVRESRKPLYTNLNELSA